MNYVAASPWIDASLWGVTAVLLTALAALAGILAAKTATKDREKERRRLLDVISGIDWSPAEAQPLRAITDVKAATEKLKLAPASRIHLGSGDDSAVPVADQAVPGAFGQAVEPPRFLQVLVEYYAFGLSHARLSMRYSFGSSVIGLLVLLFGVVRAFTSSDSQQLSSIIASVAGVVTSAIGALFHRQATQALKHMETQSTGLRADMKAERDQALAVDLLEDVQDPQLRSQLQAALILKLTGAKLPDVGGRPQRSPNGRVPAQPLAEDPAEVS